MAKNVIYNAIISIKRGYNSLKTLKNGLRRSTREALYILSQCFCAPYPTNIRICGVVCWLAEPRALYILIKNYFSPLARYFNATYGGFNTLCRQPENPAGGRVMAENVIYNAITWVARWYNLPPSFAARGKHPTRAAPEVWTEIWEC